MDPDFARLRSVLETYADLYSLVIGQTTAMNPVTIKDLRALAAYAVDLKRATSTAEQREKEARREGWNAAIGAVAGWDADKMGCPGMFETADEKFAFHTGATDASIAIEAYLRALASEPAADQEGRS